MATVPIKVPRVGESITQGILARWLKPNGSVVKIGEPLFELETDKTTETMPAEASGVLALAVEEGATVDVGSTLGSIDPTGSPSVATSPVAEALKAAPAASTSTAGIPSPSAKRLAEEENVDLAAVAGSGPGGRITKGDVIARMDQGAEPAAAPSPSVPVAAASGRRETRQRMTGIRQKIAQRLVEAQQTAAILTTFNEADLSKVMDLRAKYKETFQKKHGVGLGFMSFFTKAAVEALKAFPSVNGRIEGNEIVLHHYYDIGMAVSTERGLMVPVIRDCDQLSFAGIEKAISEFAKKAKDNAISVADLQGGTFTITNGGVFGSLLSTPILNPPQSGILGMHSIQKRAVVVDDQVVVRPMMYLAFSYDHRIIDGREAVSFLVRIKECIENPERMLIDI
jgi:2-oxoglutarate dehydrogenase E2 component (dihydrolipoamide succinyltransferase)